MTSTPAPGPTSPAAEAETSPGDATMTMKPLVPADAAAPEVEIGGPEGPEPTRYGDWERKGRCIDF